MRAGLSDEQEGLGPEPSPDSAFPLNPEAGCHLRLEWEAGGVRWGDGGRE